MLFLEGRVPAKLSVEGLDGPPDFFDVTARRRRQEPSEELVQIPMLPCQALEEKNIRRHRIAAAGILSRGRRERMIADESLVPFSVSRGERSARRGGVRKERRPGRAGPRPN